MVFLHGLLLYEVEELGKRLHNLERFYEVIYAILRISSYRVGIASHVLVASEFPQACII